MAATSIAVLAFSFAPPTFADDRSSTQCGSRTEMYATEFAALAVLSTCYAARSADEDREYFAAILRRSDGFVFVVDAGRHGIDHVSLHFTPLTGETFVALWHTHGARGPHRDLFSPTDTALVNDVRVPFYLADPNGHLRVFRPGDAVRAPKSDRLLLRPPFGASEGTVLASWMR